jgi:hypothetical protein
MAKVIFLLGTYERLYTLSVTGGGKRLSPKIAFAPLPSLSQPVD